MNHKIEDKDIFERRNCIVKGCKREFFITFKEKKFYESKEGFKLPRRCFDCRKRRREENGGKKD